MCVCLLINIHSAVISVEIRKLNAKKLRFKFPIKEKEKKKKDFRN